MVNWINRHVMSECSECGTLSALGVQRERAKERERLQLLFSASSSPHRHTERSLTVMDHSLSSHYTLWRANPYSYQHLPILRCTTDCFKIPIQSLKMLILFGEGVYFKVRGFEEV